MLTPEQEADNAEIAYQTAIQKDCPAKTWWNADPWHNAVDRALGIDRHQDGGHFALFPFRVARIDEEWRILAAYRCPITIGFCEEDHLRIETVISWNPKTNRTEIMADPQAQLVGRFDNFYGNAKAGSLFGNPRAFFQQWAIQRSRFWGFCKANADKGWKAAPTEPDLVPGALLIGDLKDIRWRLDELPEHLECVGLDAKAVNAAIIKSLRLPRVTAALNSERSAA